MTSVPIGKMKVAIVTASLSRRGGGVSAVVEALSRNLSTTGDFTVRVFGLEDEAWLTDDASMWRGAPATAFKVVGPTALGYAPDMLRELLRWGANVVHTHGIWMHPSRCVLQWHKKTGRPYVVSPHGMLDPWARRNSSIKKAVAGFLFEEAHCRKATAMHALCDAEARAIRSSGLHNAIEILPNGVDTAASDCFDAPPWEGKIDRNAKVLLYLGRLHPKKNVHGLIAAVAKLQGRGQFEHWRLVIAGAGSAEYTHQLIGMVSANGLSKHVLFTGSVFGRAKAAAFVQASAFVLPSFSEGLPMAVLEAWGSGLPVVMSAACNLSEGFDAGAALEIDVEVDALAEQLAKFIGFPDATLREMGQRGLELTKSKFSWELVARDMGRLYMRAAAADGSDLSNASDNQRPSS